MTNLNSIDNDWLNYCQGNYNSNNTFNNNINDENNIPKSNELYISTKTKISYLSNKTIVEIGNEHPSMVDAFTVYPVSSALIPWISANACLSTTASVHAN